MCLVLFMSIVLSVIFSESYRAWKFVFTYFFQWRIYWSIFPVFVNKCKQKWSTVVVVRGFVLKTDSCVMGAYTIVQNMACLHFYDRTDFTDSILSGFFVVARLRPHTLTCPPLQPSLVTLDGLLTLTVFLCLCCWVQDPKLKLHYSMLSVLLFLFIDNYSVRSWGSDAINYYAINFRSSGSEITLRKKW